jgi:hypothetical protein
MIWLLWNPKFHRHAKHINVKYHIINDKYENGEIIMA